MNLVHVYVYVPLPGVRTSAHSISHSHIPRGSESLVSAGAGERSGTRGLAEKELHAAQTEAASLRSEVTAGRSLLDQANEVIKACE